MWSSVLCASSQQSIPASVIERRQRRLLGLSQTMGNTVVWNEVVSLYDIYNNRFYNSTVSVLSRLE